MDLDTKKKLIGEIISEKRRLFLARIKVSSGDSSISKDARKIRKGIARLLTKLNVCK